MQPLYDAIGATYGTTRHADPIITQELARFVAIGNNRKFLDLACGTGNYTNALALLGGQWHGVDISEIMISQAREKSLGIEWRLGSADAIPYQSNFFDGVICTLAIHHFAELSAAFSEAHRVLRSGHFVIFTAFPEQMRGYWLGHYFPEMMRSSIEQMPSQEVVVKSLQSSGFEVKNIVPFYVTNKLQDLFLYSGKERPEQYFSAVTRSNISSFVSRCPEEELKKGLQMLSSDLKSGEFQNLAKSYHSSKGDYAYVVSGKRHS